MRHVASADNATLKRVRALAHDARARAREGASVIEGEHLCRAWLDHGEAPKLALVEEESLARTDVAACVERLEQAGGEVVALPARLLRAACSTDSPVPIVGVIVPRAGRLDACRGADGVLLDGVQDPGNVGTILRTAAAAGVVHVLCGPGTASPWSPKVLRAGMGAHPLLDIVEVDDAPAALASLGVAVLGTDAGAARAVYDADLRAPVCWAFGAEGAGLSPAVRAALHASVAIPQAPGVESLNVAAAAAVCLFEMRRQRR